MPATSRTGVDDPQLLRDSGLRVTAPRLAVLAAVREGHHATVDEIAVTFWGVCPACQSTDRPRGIA